MLVEKIRRSLRIMSNAFDGEIQDLIEACKIDLSISGVTVTDETNPLVSMAITLYCKAYFGLENPEREALIESYVNLKQHLTLSGDFNGFI